MPADSRVVWRDIFSSRVPQIVALEHETVRVRMLRALPPRLVEAIPTLRVFAVGDMNVCKTVFSYPESSSALGTPDNALRALRELQLEDRRSVRWWIVKPRPLTRELVEVWKEVGQAAMKTVEKRDFDPNGDSLIEGALADKLGLFHPAEYGLNS